MAKRFRRVRFSASVSTAGAITALCLLLLVEVSSFAIVTDVVVMAFDYWDLLGSIVLYVAICFAIWLTYLVPHKAFRLLRWRAVDRDAPYCLHCDYNLTGNVSGTCPECGTPIPAIPKARPATDPPKQ